MERPSYFKLNGAKQDQIIPINQKEKQFDQDRLKRCQPISHIEHQDQQRRVEKGTTAMQENKNRIFTAREAVAYLGISLSTLNRIEKQGLLVPYRTPGGHRRYGQKMLDEYLEATRRNH